MDLLKIFAVSTLIATLVPLSIIAGYLHVGARHRKELRSLLESFPRLSSLPSAEFAAYKYDLFQRPSGHSARFRFLTFSEVLPVGVFIGLTGVCFGLVVLLTTHPAALDQLNVVLAGFGSDQQSSGYQAAAAKFYTVTFAVPYTWSVYFLLYKAAANDLTPFHFLETSLQIVVSLFVAVVLWPLIAAWSNQFPATLSITVAAIVIGLHRPLFMISMKAWRHRRRRTEKSLELPMPLSALSGIDGSLVVTLQSRGVSDVASLATANPVVLYVELRMGIFLAIDIIGQAQLASAVGLPAFDRLRKLGVRTLGDLERLAGNGPGVIQRAAQNILAELLLPKHPALSNQSGFEMAPPASEDIGLKSWVHQMTDSLHVRRLHDIETVLTTPLAGSKGVTPLAADQIGDLEQRVRATITSALAPPMLVKYRGWVQAAIARAEGPGKLNVIVRFYRDRPGWGFVGDIRIDEGEDADWVTFDLELRVGLQHRSTVKQTVQIPVLGNSNEFVLPSSYDSADQPEMWLQVFQRNRLLQVVSLVESSTTEVVDAPAAKTEGGAKPMGASS